MGKAFPSAAIFPDWQCDRISGVGVGIMRPSMGPGDRRRNGSAPCRLGRRGGGLASLAGPCPWVRLAVGGGLPGLDSRPWSCGEKGSGKSCSVFALSAGVSRLPMGWRCGRCEVAGQLVWPNRAAGIPVGPGGPSIQIRWPRWPRNRRFCPVRPDASTRARGGVVDSQRRRPLPPFSIAPWVGLAYILSQEAAQTRRHPHHAAQPPVAPFATVAWTRLGWPFARKRPLWLRERGSR